MRRCGTWRLSGWCPGTGHVASQHPQPRRRPAPLPPHPAQRRRLRVPRPQRPVQPRRLPPGRARPPRRPPGRAQHRRPRVQPPRRRLGPALRRQRPPRHRQHQQRLVSAWTWPPLGLAISRPAWQSGTAGTFRSKRTPDMTWPHQCAGTCTTRLAPYAACGGQSTATGTESLYHAVMYSRTQLLPCECQHADWKPGSSELLTFVQVPTDSSPAAAAPQAASLRRLDAYGRVSGTQCWSEATHIWRKLECNQQDVPS